MALCECNAFFFVLTSWHCSWFKAAKLDAANHIHIEVLARQKGFSWTAATYDVGQCPIEFKSADRESSQAEKYFVSIVDSNNGNRYVCATCLHYKVVRARSQAERAKAVKMVVGWGEARSISYTWAQGKLQRHVYNAQRYTKLYSNRMSKQCTGFGAAMDGIVRQAIAKLRFEVK